MRNSWADGSAPARSLRSRTSDDATGVGTERTGAAGGATNLVHCAAAKPVNGQVLPGNEFLGRRVFSNAAGGIAIALIGFSDTSWNGVPLPFPLASIGSPGCTLLVSPTSRWPR